MKKLIFAALIIIEAVAIGILITNVIVYAICKCLGFAFSWKYAVAVYLIAWLIKILFGKGE